MIICGKISQMTEGAVDRHQMVLDDDGNTLGRLGDADLAKRAELDLHGKVEALVVEKGGSYMDGFRAVMGAPKNKSLVQCYAGLTLDKQAQRAEPDMSSQEAGLEIDSRAHSYMADHQTDYATAFRAVLTAEPELKTAYGQA